MITIIIILIVIGVLYWRKKQREAASGPSSAYGRVDRV
jgi:hypothetical protein